MKKIVFIVPDMGYGGAQRIVSVLLRNLNTIKYDVHLLIIGKNTELLPDIDAVSVRVLRKERVRGATGNIRKYIKEVQPDVLFTTLSYLNLYILLTRSLFPRTVKIIIREGTILSELHKKRKVPGLLRLVYRLFYVRADAIVCQSEYMKEDLIKFYGIPRSLITRIHNPLDYNMIRTSLHQDVETGCPEYTRGNVNLLTIGRLSYEKNYASLLRIIAGMDDTRLHLFIIGEGPEKKALQAYAEELHLGQRVHFLGTRSNPYPYIEGADLFVQTSLYEGFPNVVLEAIACGTPVAAFNCPGGIGEIICTGKNGFLIDAFDEHRFADALSQALVTDWDTEWMVEDVRSRFGACKINAEYEALLDAL